LVNRNDSSKVDVIDLDADNENDNVVILDNDVDNVVNVVDVDNVVNVVDVDMEVNDVNIEVDTVSNPLIPITQPHSHWNIPPFHLET